MKVGGKGDFEESLNYPAATIRSHSVRKMGKKVCFARDLCLKGLTLQSRGLGAGNGIREIN